jgi:acetyl esterase/lipase
MTNGTPVVRVIEGPGSWHSRAVNTLLRLMLRSPLRHDADIPALRRRYEEIDARHFPLDDWVTRVPVDCSGVPSHWVSVPETRPERVLFYLHGGSFAYRFPFSHAAFAARICRRLGARALLPDYRLAPENPYPAAPDDCLAAYRWLLESGVNPKNVVFVGDSAGGNLALVTLLRAREAGEPLPACAVLLSPGVDCTLSSRSMVDNADRDPMLLLNNLVVLRNKYVPVPELITHPHVSPLFGDFEGLPPLLLQVGSGELLRDESVRVAHKAQAAGVDVELELWPDTPHVFQIVSFLPESLQALEHIVRFVLARTAWPG